LIVPLAAFAIVATGNAVNLTDGLDGHNGRYGTVGTPNKFWANWREEVIQEPEFHAIKNKALSANVVNALFADRKAADRQWFDGWLSGGLVPTGQDKLLVSLCRPDRLLEMIRYYTFTDSKNGKIVARIIKYAMPSLSSVDFKENAKRDLSAEQKIAQLNARYRNLPDPTVDEEGEEGHED
jgi:type I site-specific restriction-modification system R (restriction) subunit